ncbi:hypothetical protein BDQ17DRAFT_1369161 [Cyathus striatus]|nr:hypothetical protein BDQ17DRAFT_1369161 [Cyathus striatus]
MADPMNRAFLTSPPSAVPGMLDSFDSPLDDTPFTDFLNTPIIGDLGDDFGGSPNMYEGASLFPEMMMYHEQPQQEKQSEPQSEGLYTISPRDAMVDAFPPTPATPALPAFSPNQPTSALPTTAPASTSRLPSVALSTSNKRKSSATGTRKGLTPQALVPLDAPTQPRKYVTPSATSRKEVPAVFARKRARSQAFDEDELEELPPDASEQDQIEWKRRQNTIAARRSRKRKLEHQQHLENEIVRLQGEANRWRDRANVLQSVLKSKGVAFEFGDDP